MGDGNDIAVLHMLGNLLALPNTINQQADEATKMRAILASGTQGPGGPPLLTPEQLDQFAPQAGRFPGSSVPVLGSVLKGVGNVGQVLQTITSASPAPRGGDSMKGINDFLTMQREAGLNRGRTSLAGGIRENAPRRELGARAVEAGATSEGLRYADDGTGGVRLPFQLWQRDNPGGTYSDWLADSQRATGTGGPKNEFGLYMTDRPAWEQLQRDRARSIKINTDARLESKEQFAKLPAMERNVYAQADQMKTVVTQVLAALDDPNVANDRGVVEGRLRQALYLGGFSTSPDEDAYITLSNFGKILGAQPFATRSRAWEYIKQIQQHLFQPGDTAELLRSKSAVIGTYLDKLQDSLLNAEQTVPQLREQRRIEETGKKPQPDATGNTPVTTLKGGPAANQAVVQGQSVRELAAQLLPLVKAGTMTKEEAQQQIQGARDAGLPE